MPTGYSQNSIAPARDRKFLENGAPLGVLSKIKRRRQIVHEAVAEYITGESPARERAAARSWLRELDRIAREKPETTSCGMMSLTGKRVSIWIFEPDMAPIGETVQVILDCNAILAKGLDRLRAAQSS